MSAYEGEADKALSITIMIPFNVRRCMSARASSERWPSSLSNTTRASVRIVRKASCASMTPLPKSIVLNYRFRKKTILPYFFEFCQKLLLPLRYL